MGTFGQRNCRTGLVAKLSTAWLGLFVIFAILWANAADARPATLAIGQASASGPAISVETRTGEVADLVSVEANSVVVGPLIATKLQFDFAPLQSTVELRVRLPARAVLLESESAGYCNGDVPATFASGTWTKRLGFESNHASLIYVQPLDHGRAVVASAVGQARLARLGATLTDEDGRELAEPLVLTHSEAAADVIAQLDLDTEAYRAGDLAMVKVSPGGELAPVPIRDAVVLIDTSASSGKELSRRIEQARALATVTRGKLALIAFDQSTQTVFNGASRDLPESAFESIARRGALGATNLESAFSAIEALARQHEFQRVFLLSDGIATAGLSDRASLSSRVARWAKLGIRQLDVVAPEFGRDQALLEALVTAGLAEHGRVASSGEDLVREFEQPSLPELPISIPGAVAQSSWALVSPLPDDERWVLARVPEGVTLRVRVGKRAPQILSPQPVWRPLFERYFEQQGLIAPSSETKRSTLVLEHGKLSMLQASRRLVVGCCGGLMVNGRLPPEIIQRIVRLNFGRFRGCAVQNHQAPIVPKGRVTARFVIGKDGQVTSVSDVGSTVPNADFVRCVLQAFTTLQFTSPPSGPVTVVYPLVFGDGEDESQPGDDNSRSYSDDIPENYVPVKLSNPEYPLLPKDVGTEAYEGAFRNVMQAIAENRPEDAEKAARSLLETHPNTLLAYLAWGRAAEARGNLSEARRAYGSLLDRFPDKANLHRVAAAWLSHLGDRSSEALAIDALSTAIRLKDGRAESERELAWLLARDGAYEAALEQLTVAFLHMEDRPRDLLKQEIAILASALLAQHPERRSTVFAQLKRTGTPLVSRAELVFALQNESERILVLSLYADPDKGRLRATPYSDAVNPTAYEVVATERRAPYAVRVADRGDNPYATERALGLGCVRILDYDGRAKLHIEIRPFVLQMPGTEVDLANYG